MNGGRDSSRRPERTDFRSQSSGIDQSKAQLDAINVKLDKILSILNPVTLTAVVKEVKAVKEEKVVEAVKPEKAKKVVKKVAPEKKK